MLVGHRQARVAPTAATEIVGSAGAAAPVSYRTRSACVILGAGTGSDGASDPRPGLSVRTLTRPLPDLAVTLGGNHYVGHRHRPRTAHLS